MKLSNTSVFFSAAVCVIVLTCTLSIGVDVMSVEPQFDDLKKETTTETNYKSAAVWNDLDFDSFDGKTCGYRKCFLLSKSDRDFGYLVGHPFFLRMDTQGYNLAVRLEQENGINQPHITPPEKVPFNSYMIQQIAANEKLRDIDRSVAKDIYPGSGEFVVTKVRTIKNDAVEVGCKSNGTKTIHRLRAKLPEFVKKSPNPIALYENLQRGIEQTKKVYRNNPRLYRDLQFMVDKFGIVHHMDFDRAFQGRRVYSEEWIEECYGNLDRLVTKARDLAQAEEKERNISHI